MRPYALFCVPAIFPQRVSLHLTSDKCTNWIKIVVLRPWFISLPFFLHVLPCQLCFNIFLFVFCLLCSVSFTILLCMCLLLDQAFLSHSISLSLPLAMCSSSGVAGDHHAAATAGAGSSVTGYPDHGKQFRPQTAPLYVPNVAPAFELRVMLSDLLLNCKAL